MCNTYPLKYNYLNSLYRRQENSNLEDMLYVLSPCELIASLITVYEVPFKV